MSTPLLYTMLPAIERSFKKDPAGTLNRLDKYEAVTAERKLSFTAYLYGHIKQQLMEGRPLCHLSARLPSLSDKKE